MKLYTMKCIKDPERMDECFEPDNQEERYFVKLETEEAIYWDESDDFRAGYMTAKLGVRVEDKDIYCYLYPDEIELDVGDTYEDADGLVWERVE